MVGWLRVCAIGASTRVWSFVWTASIDFILMLWPPWAWLFSWICAICTKKNKNYLVWFACFRATLYTTFFLTASVACQIQRSGWRRNTFRPSWSEWWFLHSRKMSLNTEARRLSPPIFLPLTKLSSALVAEKKHPNSSSCIRSAVVTLHYFQSPHQG